jgi:hypothetical protein
MSDAARKAARGLNRDFGELSELQVSRKAPADFVSAADKKAEEERWKDAPMSGDDYGYGLSIHLDDRAVAKLGLTDTDLDTGEAVKIEAMAMISSETVNTINGKTQRTITLQIQKMGLSQEISSKAKALYGDD